MKLSQKLADFNIEVNNSVPYIANSANATRLKLDPAQVSAQQGRLTDWNTKYGLYKNPATHTEQAVKDINDLFDTFHSEMQGIKQQLKHNKSIVLTGTDYKEINIHEDNARRHHIPRTSYSPVNTVLKQSHLVVKIFTSNPNPPHEKETSLPEDVHRIGRKIAITKVTDDAPAAELYHNLEVIGSTVYDLVFDTTNVGAKVYLVTFYINPRGEEGPLSHPVSFIVT